MKNKVLELKSNESRFNNELKMYINRKLFEKKIITEDMYNAVKEILVKEAG